uniref:centromere-associated protein E isoform X4 n=1 Tax=Solea senegalensis TaxID=28829 RepID=UPI001CD84DE2|nr:centromere-associated protein E isoform X4 [Solea senegalensis]
MGEESAVKVCVRVRPLIAREESVPSEDAEPVQLFWKTDKKSVHQIDDGNTTKSFSFDRVFAAEETTNHLYQDIAKPLVVSTVEGYNGTIFAYGQTSSGKTFTMMGSDHIPGVIPLAVEDVFQTIKNCPKKEFLLRVSYMEIYNETVTDLLVDSWKRKPLEVREAIHKNIYVADLTEELVTSPAQALAWIRKGEKNRHYGKTKMNQRSSRSHAIFRMILESRERSEPGSGENADGAIIVSHLNLVDLAGSERASQTGAEGTRFKEGCNINRSLFTLGQVIKKLTDESQKGFTNYRDSKLTRILQNSLGGNAKTVIICTITPAALDETLSTLQFASTAKKMKNDPHVTEVSDDGALLKRYRNEIVDLKRRLQEVSSVTQTTVTEKEVLAHLLQEKDQLQREQEDRIRNLTRLMVTSSDLVPVKKMPKRRVTWGGKMVRLARPSLCGSGSSDLSFADPFTLKRKAGHSCLMEMTEDDEDFDVHWDVPDEPSDEMETTQGSVAVRSFEYSPKDASPDWMSDISQKVSNLELQLEMESQQKEEAMTKVTVLESRVSELQLQLQTEAQLKHEALGNMETAEKRAAEQELLQLTEAQQKLEAVEKVTMLDLRVVDLERQLESQSHALTENEQMRREFAETIQLLETLASEKDLAITERDYLRQELGLFIERIELLEKEKAALTQELEEKRETDEFKSLEDEFRKEHENELKNEMLSLKKAFESSEVKCLEFQNKVETLSEELKKKSEFAEELQSMSGKDLVQEVAKLRRSLDDAEGVSRDTKKEWAFLRSHNIALEEMNATFTANHKRMEAEVNSLHSQLEKEKSHSKNMQSDLQKELNIAFNENTKLTALLDGKVPKELIDSVELERTVTSLSKELTAARQEEEALRAQLQELASLQTLPHEMDNMVKQLEESEQQRALVVNRLKEMQQLMQEEKLADSEVSRNTEEDISRELQEQELQCVQAKKATEPMAAAQSSADETEKLLSTVAALSAERDQLKIDLQENIEMMIENQEELRTALEKIRELKEWIKQLETAQTSKQDASLTHVCPQLEALQKQVDDLQATLQLVNEQKHELERDLQHNMKMAAEVQSTLQPLQEQLQEQNQRNEDLERQSAERQAHLEQKITETESLLCCLQEELQEQKQKNSDLVKQRESDSQQQTKTLTEELENTRAERDTLLFEKENGCQLSSEKENLLCRVMSLSEERDQLQETLHTLRQEKQQLRAELEDKIEMMQCDFQLQLCSQPQSLKEEQEDQQHLQIQELEKQLEKTQEEVLQLRSDLQENVEQMIENQDELRASQEKVRVLQDQMNILRSHVSELESRTSSSGDAERLLQIQELQNQIKTLTEELENMKMERDHLLSERTTCCQSTPSESEETREKQQLGAELEDKTETLQSEVKTLTEKLQCSETERDDLRSEVEASCRSTSSDKEKLLCLSEERDHLQETLNTLRQEKQQLRAELEDKMETLQNEVKTLTEKLQCSETERDDLRSEVEASCRSASSDKEKLLCLSEERDHLQETLNTLRQEKQQLRAELEDKMETLQNEVKTLTEKLQCSETERDDLRSEVEASCRSASSDKEKLLCLSEERDHLQETLNTLRQEKQQLRAELEDKLETISAIEENLSKQDQSEREQKANLQQEVQQLGVKETLSSRLHDSTEQLQESFRGFKSFIDTCHCYSTTPRDRALSAQGSLKHLSSLPKATMDAYTTVCRLGLQTVHTLGNIIVCLQWHAQDYRDLFEELVQKDLAVFEEKRVQDVLLCRAQAPSLSLGDEDFHSLWGHRLTELLGKRLLYKQKMDNILERLWANIPPYPTELSAEVRARERFTEQLKATYSTQSLSFSELDTILNCELERRAALTHNKEMTLQSIKDEQRRVMEELSLLVAHANSQLKEERSKSSTLLQGLDGVPLKAELSLLKDNQQLVLQLQQMEKEVKTLKEQNVQLQEAQVEANSRVSKQKEATQLLQTELLDSRAHNHEKETTIQTLRNKLQQQEKKTPPSAAELEKLQTKMFQMEVELSSASDKHQQEIHRMNTVLKGKEDSLRKLKEILRSQQQGEGSFLKGEDLHTKLTNPRGLVIRSSFLQDKAKLEEEVKQLKLKITELESLVSTLHTEIGKWKSRAIKLKVKSKAEVDRPSSPCTPTKRCLPVTSESSTFLGSPKKFVVTPKKILESSRRAMESPNVTLPDSPKSRFFDVCGSLELLSTSCPKPFFDNSSLGTIPEATQGPDPPGVEKDADVGAAKKEEWWPQSPKQEDMCQTQ